MLIWNELKRRNVVRVAVLYVVAAWLLLQIADVLISLVQLPSWAGTLVVVLVVLGFFPVAIFAWVYELGPEGLRKESGTSTAPSGSSRANRKINALIVILLILAIGSVWLDRILPQRAPPEQQASVHPAASMDLTSPVEGEEPALAGGVKTIAVLPFENMSPDVENEYFSDGLSEELLNELTQVPELRVASRTSSFAFKGQNKSISEIAESLRVDHVLEGSVRKAGETVRITAQLIDARDGFHLWSQTYDRKLVNILVIQDEIAASVAGALQAKLLGGEAETSYTNPEVHVLYLQGLGASRQFSPAALADAEERLSRAITLDADYAPAWLALSRVFANQARLRMVPEDVGFDKSREAAERAIALDGQLGKAYAGLGFIAMHELDLAEAAQYLARARAIAPDDAEVLNSVALLYFRLGRIDQSVPVFKRAIEIDPFGGAPYINLAFTFLNAGQPDKAEQILDDASSLGLNISWMHWMRGRTKLDNGDAESALEEFLIEPDELSKLQGQALAFHSLGRQEEFDATVSDLRKIFTSQPENSGWVAFYLAVIHAYRGNNDQAFEWLDRARELGTSRLLDLPSHGILRKLKDDPRWDDLVVPLGFSESQLAEIDF